MGSDLVVLALEPDDDIEHALGLYRNKCRGEPADDKLRSFVDTLEAEFDARGDWPWTMPKIVRPSYVLLEVAHERWEEVVSAVVALAHAEGLSVLVPSGGALYRPPSCLE